MAPRLCRSGASVSGEKAHAPETRCPALPDLFGGSTPAEAAGGLAGIAEALMNLRRGSLRLWMVLSIAWIITVGFHAYTVSAFNVPGDEAGLLRMSAEDRGALLQEAQRRGLLTPEQAQALQFPSEETVSRIRRELGLQLPEPPVKLFGVFFPTTCYRVASRMGVRPANGGFDHRRCSMAGSRRVSGMTNGSTLVANRGAQSASCIRGD